MTGGFGSTNTKSFSHAPGAVKSIMTVESFSL